MRRGPRTGNEKLSPELERQVDQLCDRFEAAWKAGQQAPIEGFLADISETGCGAALRELLFLELAYRIQAGEKPILKEYQLRFPEHAEVVSAVFREGISVTRLGPDNSETSGLSGANSLDQADAGETGPPLDLGRYQITAEVGRGGFGVAIKVPHRHCLATPGYAQTFLREARILASLDHPGIVPVYDVAQADDGVSY